MSSTAERTAQTWLVVRVFFCGLGTTALALGVFFAMGPGPATLFTSTPQVLSLLIGAVGALFLPPGLRITRGPVWGGLGHEEVGFESRSGLSDTVRWSEPDLRLILADIRTAPAARQGTTLIRPHPEQVTELTCKSPPRGKWGAFSGFELTLEFFDATLERAKSKGLVPTASRSEVDGFVGSRVISLARVLVFRSGTTSEPAAGLAP